MKMKWEEPRIEVQKFMPNEYVAACIVGSIQCVYPGANSWKKGDNNIYDDWSDETGYQLNGVYTDSRNMAHGLCGNETPVSINGDKAQGYETVNGSIATNRPLYNVNPVPTTTGTFYVTWNSNDQGKMGDMSDGVAYYHKGRLTVTYIDTDHPNRS